jgi:gas vesicle protein
MSEQPKSFSDLPRLALDSYHEEYRHLSETWRSLDTKAQGLGALAGIFLAAVFASAREPRSGFGSCERVLVVATILLLVGAIIAAVFALRVRSLAAPPLGEETAQMVADILHKAKADELEERVAAFYNDQMKAWNDTNKQMRQHALSKAARIKWAETTLVLAGVLVAALSMFRTLSVR